MFRQPRYAYAVMALLIVLPQALYVIGDYMAVGIRFPFFRWQESAYGTSIIPVTSEVAYLQSGIIGWTTLAGGYNRTALATVVWIAGLAVLIAAAAMVISWHLLGNSGHARYAGSLLIATGILFLLWGMVQYGPLLHGPTGYAIPVGVPVLWYCGWQFMKAAEAAGDQVA
jgi:hypothetical protein